MNFTREPIIETIITPKEGYKLIIRGSKRGDQEEYIVDAVEVVSFGHSFFFRCLERPKSFLVPVSDYEVIETKETRVVLKNVNLERAIKIAGGREAGVKAAKAEKTSESEPAVVEQRLEKKRERRRHRRRRVSEEKEDTKPVKEAVEGGGADDEMKVSSSTSSRLIPPPSKLIAIQEIKSSEATEGDVLPEQVEEKEIKKPRKRKRRKKTEGEKEALEDESSASGGNEMQRATVEPVSTTTSFSTLDQDSIFSTFGKIW